MRSIAFLAVFLLAGSTPPARASNPPNYVLEWGSPGSEPGRFNSPIDIAGDSQGNLYVVETGNDRLQKFDSLGRFIATWGRGGSSTGQFRDPHAVVIDANDLIYVLDSGNSRVQVFSVDGIHVRSFGERGEGEGEFDNPRGIAVSPDGDIYVADTFNDRIQVFDAGGRFLRQWGGTGTSPVRFDRPSGIDIDQGSNVYVADFGNERITKFTPGGLAIAFWDVPFYSGHLAVDEAATIYTSNSGTHRIERYDGDGNLLCSFGEEGEEAGEFIQPRGMLSDNADGLYLVDTGNNRIQYFQGGAGPIENILSLGNASGSPADHDTLDATLGAVPIDLNLSVSERVYGVDLLLRDRPDWLSVSAVELVQRAEDMSIGFSDSISSRILIYSLEGNSIRSGTGTVARIWVHVDSMATVDSTIDLEIAEAVLSDPFANAIPTETRNGSFQVITTVPGDVNLDNRVNVGDAIRLVEILLGEEEPPSPRELTAADCNEDAAINILDVVCVTNLIFALPAPSVVTLGGQPVAVELRIEEEVLGLQVVFPEGVTQPEIPDNPPFQAATGRDRERRGVLAVFDAEGASWPAETFQTLYLPMEPVEIQAYGHGGRALSLREEDGVLVVGGAPTLPVSFTAMPNPFRGATTLVFDAESTGPLLVSIFDLRGRLVTSYRDEIRFPGRQELPWNAASADRHIAPGVYFARLQQGGQVASVRLTLLGPG